jgi:DNA-binding transcriptional LysR family regulator
MAHVRYFLALCQERNFTRAARRCGVAQPSLTRAIKRLEAELEGVLFHRKRGGAELTDFGARLQPYFAEICRCVEEIKRRSKSVSIADRKSARKFKDKLGLSMNRRTP